MNPLFSDWQNTAYPPLGLSSESGGFHLRFGCGSLGLGRKFRRWFMEIWPKMGVGLGCWGKGLGWSFFSPVREYQLKMLKLIWPIVKVELSIGAYFSKPHGNSYCLSIGSHKRLPFCDGLLDQYIQVNKRVAMQCVISAKLEFPSNSNEQAKFLPVTNLAHLLHHIHKTRPLWWALLNFF